MTGYYYLRARYYNPTIGRFTQEDTYRGDGLNLYVYVKNNPLKYVDPSGHAKCNIEEKGLLENYSKYFLAGPNNTEEISSQFDKYFFASVGFIDYADSIPLFDNIIEKLEDGINNLKSIIELAKLIKDLGITNSELHEILADKFTDSTIGGILYVKDNYHIMKNDVTTTIGEAYNLGYHAGKAYNEVVNIGATVYGVTKAIKNGVEILRAKETGKAIPEAESLTMTKTVQNHMTDIIKRGENAGELARPYIDSNGTTLLTKEIMESGTPVVDSALANGLRWDVEGTFRGSTGMWELVVDLDKNTIVHFNFVTK